ncbi:hypothetical protein BDN72DRAFT_864927 [Pluteus cervinus]|uniref:Uncharacterized protein n=1 Tax=Pluteus cervinus TaxID=181527 RepID=A0ACD3A351_9AGAR|nr:hypothetical protein BDN72DRAFT_864927 [Pluteus cervinus]
MNFVSSHVWLCFFCLLVFDPTHTPSFLFHLGMTDHFLGLSSHQAKWLRDLLADYTEQEPEAVEVLHSLHQCMLSNHSQGPGGGSERPCTPEGGPPPQHASPMQVDSPEATQSFSIEPFGQERSPEPFQPYHAIKDSRRVIPIPPSPTKVNHLTPYLEPSPLEQEDEDEEEQDDDDDDDDNDNDEGKEKTFEGQEQPGQEIQLWGPEWDEDYADDEDPSPTSIPEKQVLSSTSKGILVKVGELGRLLLSENASEQPDVVAVKKGFDIMFGVSEKAKTGSLQMLAGLANTCFNLEMTEAAIRFRYIISVMLFRLSVHNAVLAANVSCNKILEDLSITPGVQASLPKLGRYSAEGGKFCLLTGAALVAAVSNKSELMGFTGDEVARGKTNGSLDYPEGKIIVQSIIPAIAYLRQTYTFILPTNLNLTNTWHFNLSNSIDYGQVDCQDLRQTDKLMDSLSYDCFVKGRDDTTWASCLTPVTSLAFPSNLPIPQAISFDSAGEEPLIIKTQFDSNLEINKKVTFNRGVDEKSLAERLEWTERERVKASNAKVSPIFPKFSRMYKNFLAGGFVPENDETYWKFHRSLWEK